MKKSILVVVAHPDDEVLGCGGTIKRLADEGNDIHIVVLGEGATSRYADGKENARKEVERLKQACGEATSLLGVRDVFHVGLPDNKLDAVPMLNIVQPLEKLVEELKPTIIFTHHPSDLNIDHTVANRAVMTATRPINECTVEEIYTFETPSSTEWSFGSVGFAFSPNVFYDICSTFAAKVAAINCYESELRAFPHPRSVQALSAIAERWGSVAGVQKAEAFELIRSVRR